MKSKARAANKAEKERMSRLKEMPCVCCRRTNSWAHWGTTSEVHHLLSGNKRRGHLFTIPLCPYHHRGEVGVLGRAFLEKILGPSLALSSKRFHATFGTDDELLELTNRQLEGKL